jgi:acetyl-CoA C-acetyltransferase
MQCAMIENVLLAAEGLSVEKHRPEIASLWAGFAAVARDNPDAWMRDDPDAAPLLDPAVFGVAWPPIRGIKQLLFCNWTVPSSSAV